MDVLSNLGSYFDSFDKPLNVSVISKLGKWQNFQSLGHDAMLANLSENFYGIKDAKMQFSLHTAANPVQLGSPYAAIRGLILVNAETNRLMGLDPVLGQVGPSVLKMDSLGAVFSLPVSALSGGKSEIGKMVS